MFVHIWAIIPVIRNIIWATSVISPIRLNHPRVRQRPVYNSLRSSFGGFWFSATSEASKHAQGYVLEKTRLETIASPLGSTKFAKAGNLRPLLTGVILNGWICDDFENMDWPFVNILYI